MKRITLKQILLKEDVQENIKINYLFEEESEFKKAIDKIIAFEKENTISVALKRSGEEIIFESTLYEDKDKEAYLLRCVLLKLSGEVIDGYLEIFDKHGKIVDDFIDDVWEFANWKEIN